MKINIFHYKNINGERTVRKLSSEKINKKLLMKYLKNDSLSYNPVVIDSLFDLYMKPIQPLLRNPKSTDEKITSKNLTKKLKHKTKDQLIEICRQIQLGCEGKNKNQLIELLSKHLKKHL
tara:strand:+ start:1951 stop:2310 length:360 start_codon:yes stop_codon:yes gene_type:complete